MRVVMSLFLILLVLPFLYAQTPVSWKELQSNIDSWMEGPVGPLLTSEERDVFKKLKTPEEKMQFIKIFWARRDTVLRTRANEFKDEFYKRVDYANQNFGERNVSGWKTARGQVYLLFGPPSRIDHQTVPDSSRPALLWVYDSIPSDAIPRNEALMFVWREFKYVLAPPNPDPGDRIAAAQRQTDSAFRYQDIPSAVQQAFVDVTKANVFDERKNYQDLLFSVKTTEKFGISEIRFDTKPLQTPAKKIEITVPAEAAPVYDSGEQLFAEFYVTLELKKGDTSVAKKEDSASFTWKPEEFDKMEAVSMKVDLPQAPAGEYDLFVTVQDRISSVSETRKVAVQL